MLRAHGFEVRGLEAGGDFLATVTAVTVDGSAPLTLAVESKWQNVARPWAWQAQSLRDRVPGALPVIAFRRDRSLWWGMSPLDELLAELAEPRR